MRHRSWRLVVATALAALAPALLAGQPVTVTVLHVNDTHSRLDAFGPKDLHLDGTLGGLAKAATVIRKAQATARSKGEGTLLLHAGDASVGDFFWNTYLAVPELQILQSLGLDAMTLGNHELDLGSKILTQVLLAARPPAGFTLLSANLNTAPCKEPANEAYKCAPLVDLILPSKIVEVQGVKVGIVGATTPDDPVANGGVAPMGFLGGEAAVGAAIDAAAALRYAGAQVVILLSHLGFAYDRAIAGYPPAAGLIDFIVEGHDHTLLTQPLKVNNGGWITRIVSAGEFYEHVGRLRFQVLGGSVQFLDYRVLPVSRSVPADPAVKALVDGMKAQIVAKYGDVYHTPIALAPWNLEKTTPSWLCARDSAMGNLVTDAFRNAAQAEIGLAATGFISERIYRGPVVGADVFRPLGYGWDFVGNSGKDYPMVVASMTGAQLLQGIGLGVALLGQTDGLLMQVSGLRYAYDLSKPPNERLILSSVRVGAAPIDPARTYRVAANVMVVEIAKALLQTNIPYTPAGYTEYDAAHRWVKRIKLLAYTPQGRILDVSVSR